MADSLSENTKKIVAIDIDEVLANIVDAIRLWANEKTGSELQPEDYRTKDDFWSYYDSIWQRHGLSEQVTFEMVLRDLAVDQSHIPVIEGAAETVRALLKKYTVVFITSRPPYQEDATRRWLNEHIDSSIPLYLSYHPGINDAARSKGEICADIGASVLIDDNIGNCQSALDAGVDAIVFGDYGWNEDAPAHMTRCRTWREVGELLLNE